MHLLRFFPDLGNGHFRVTSPQTKRYNCIAWAAGDDRRWWWPDRLGIAYWPPTAPREETIEAFKIVYSHLGYEECPTPDLEEGWQKVAIFANSSGRPTHAARQLDDGNWTSKCGDFEDIEHVLVSLEGDSYGRVVCFMRRRMVEP